MKYRVTYHDPSDPGFGHRSETVEAADRTEAAHRWYDSADSQGFEDLEIITVKRIEAAL